MAVHALERPAADNGLQAGSAFDTIRSWPARAFLNAACGGATLLLSLAKRSPFLWRLGARAYPTALDRVAAFIALSTCRLARRTVPAYSKLLATGPQRRFRRLRDFPEISKDSFAKVYPFEAQCRHGHVRLTGASVDESSGSTGVPYNWLRSSAELKDVQRNIANYISMMFPREKLFCINAFSMGAWGTGMNFTMAMHENGLVKSIGPDIGAIISTLRTFGPDFNYLITGYPPLLKNLCDELDAGGVAFDAYRLYALVGGEAITEALRDYLARRFKKILSGYGASDVQLAIGGETDFTVALRKAIADDQELRYALLGEGEDRAPMIFQYNPLEVFIEVNDNSELIFTATHAASMCPKPRYNLRDEGKLLGFAETLDVIRRTAGTEFVVPHRGALKLPLLFLFGRSDSTISVMGANIYPQDVEYGLYARPDLAAHVQRFCLTLEEHDDLRTMATVNVELRAEIDAESATRLESELSVAVTTSLESLSRDFANARRENPLTTVIDVRVFKPGCGPFAAGRQGIKNRYVMRADA